MLRSPKERLPKDVLDAFVFGIDERSIDRHLILSATHQDEFIEDDTWLLVADEDLASPRWCRSAAT